jgi:hypothetical protein
LEEAIGREKHHYEQSRGRPIFQRAWNHNMKGKRDKRPKYFKTSVFKNNSQENQQGQSTQNEPRMEYSFGKGQGNNLYIVGNVREITYIGTTLKKEK